MVIRKKNLVTHLDKKKIDSINQIIKSEHLSRQDFLINAINDFKSKLGSNGNYSLKFEHYDRTFSDIFSLIILGDLIDEFVGLAHKLDLPYTKLFREILSSYVENYGKQ